MLEFLKKSAGRVVGVAKNVITKGKAAFAFIGAAILTVAVQAQEGGVSYTPIEKAADGTITFTPEKVMTPVVDGVMAAYGQWAILVVIFIVVGLMIWIFKKK